MNVSMRMLFTASWCVFVLTYMWQCAHEFLHFEKQFNGIEKYAMHYLEEENAEFALIQLCKQRYIIVGDKETISRTIRLIHKVYYFF